MALNLYLDDCANSDLLADLLRRAGHTVTRPSQVGLEGEDDEDHFAFAVANQLTLITKNPSDFLILHGVNPQHYGILAIYQDNDPSRDMSDADIVRTITNLEDSVLSGGHPIPGNFHSLNDWRY